MKRYARRRSFGRGASRPSRDWCSLATNFTLSSITASTKVTMVSLEQPTDLSALTADPPEDLTVLRIMGDMMVSVDGTASEVWILGLIVQDQTWTQGASFAADADKRWLWHQMYTSNGTATLFRPPGYCIDGASLAAGLPREATRLDISPKVKISAGKSLFLVAYEVVDGATFTVVSANMRMLYQRSGRR